MPVINADDAIRYGLYLRAKKPVNKYVGGNLLQPVYTFKPGENIGKVYSYIYKTTPGNQLYWMVENPFGGFFYVKHENGVFDKTEIDSLVQQINSAAEAKKKEEEGPVLYYIKKYADKILYAAIGVAILKSIINKKS